VVNIYNEFMETLTASNLQKAISADLVIIDFFAPWCRPCIAFAPIFEKFSKEFDSKIKFFKVDIDESPTVGADYDILSIPTILVFKDGVEIERKFGAMNEIDFRIWLNGLLAKHSVA